VVAEGAVCACAIIVSLAHTLSPSGPSSALMARSEGPSLPSVAESAAARCQTTMSATEQITTAPSPSSRSCSHLKKRKKEREPEKRP